MRIAGTISVFRLFSQHLPSRPGSHQQASGAASGGAGGGLAPLQHLVLVQRAAGEVDDGVHRAGVGDEVHRQRRGVDDAGAGAGDELPLQPVRREAAAEELGDAAVLVADQRVDVLPGGVRRVGGRVQRVVGDVAGAAGHADAERRLDRAVPEAVEAAVRALGVVGEEGGVALPAADPLPGGGVEARVGELAQAERAGGGAEAEVAGALALVGGAVRGGGVEGRVLEVAGRVAVALAADEGEERVVARAPGEAVGLGRRAGRAVGIARDAAVGVGDGAPGLEEVAAVVGAEDGVPVDRAAEALRVGVGEEAVVEGGGEHPDLAAGALRGGELGRGGGEIGAEHALRAGGRGRERGEDREHESGEQGGEAHRFPQWRTRGPNALTTMAVRIKGSTSMGKMLPPARLCVNSRARAHGGREGSRRAAVLTRSGAWAF